MTSRGFSYDPKTVSSTLLGPSDEVVLCSRSFVVFVRVEQSRVNPSRRIQAHHVEVTSFITHLSIFRASMNSNGGKSEKYYQETDVITTHYRPLY
jgi:hypothetical protein